MDAPSKGVTTDALPPVVAPVFAPGVVIAGRYRIESRLGAGGGGTVWRCIDEKLDAIVALKIVSAEGDLERWRREVAMARRIMDRNVCRVHDLGEADGVRFVTMELVEGVGLRTKIDPATPAAEARDLFAQVVSGVAAIHAAGVVHRDLKPENVVVATDGRAVIVDFGLAREPRAPGMPPGETVTVEMRQQLEGAATVEMRTPSGGATVRSDRPASATVTNAGVIVGTPRYMSPEQAAGDTVDARADVWALGLIGHELLAGTLPGHDENGRGRRVDAGALAKWPQAAPVLRKCLALLPGERYADARELRSALARTDTRRGPRRGLLAALAIAAIAAVAVFGVRAWRSDSSEKTAPTNDQTKPPVVDVPRSTGPARLKRITTIPASEFPGATPMSVALSPDAKEYAYTTGGGRLFIRSLAGGPPEEWFLPKIIRQREGKTPDEYKLITVWVAGWFSDRSVAIVGTTYRGWHLVRVYKDGKHAELHYETKRLVAAVSAKTDAVAIALDDSGLFLIKEPHELEQITAIGNGEQVMALALSPDGTRIAVGLLPPTNEDAKIQVMSLTGNDIKTIWKGQAFNSMDGLVGWLDERRLVFTHVDGNAPAKLLTHDLGTGKTTQRYQWKAHEYAGIGSAARGELVVLMGDADTFSAKIGDEDGEKLRLLHAPGALGRLVAGWTPDGRVVFAQGERGKAHVVRASPTQGIEQWPGLTDNSLPNTLVGEDVIVHRNDAEKKQAVIERVTPSGKRKVLHRVAQANDPYFVRCAGDRAAPCFLQQIVANQMTWSDFDPETGAVGKVIYKRPVRARYGHVAALSPDGQTLAVVEETHELLLVEKGSESVRPIDAGDGVMLYSVSFAPDGSLWATAFGYDGRLFTMVQFRKSSNGQISKFSSARGDRRDDSLHWFHRPMPSPDGKHVAVVVREFRTDVARVEGL